MLSPKLLSFLSAFSSRDRSQFDRFLQSPYFNESKTLLALFQHLNNRIPDEGMHVLQQDKQLDKRVVWKKLYGKAPYKDGTLRRICSELLQLAYQFTYINNCISAEKEEIIAVLNTVAEPHQEKHFRGLSRKFNALQQKENRPEEDQYRQFYDYHLACHKQLEARAEKQTDFSHLEKADYYLNCSYYLHKLRHYCDALGYGLFSAQKPDIRIPRSLFREIEQGGYADKEPWLRAYLLVARLFEAEDGEDLFYPLKSAFFDHIVGQVPEPDANALCIHLSNYCIIKKINAGEAHFFHELFDVYRKAIEAGLLMKNGILSYQDYKNIITVGLHIKELDWVEFFIQNYTERLPEEHRQNAHTYNLAKVYFHQEKYDEVIAQLREVEYESIVYTLGSKLLLLLTYFEMGEFLALDSLLDSFRIYLRRNREIARDVKEQYVNVIRFTRRLSRVSPGDDRALQKIEQQIRACEALASRQWLQEKIAEMRN
jgi:hypothetical protein